MGALFLFASKMGANIAKIRSELIVKLIWNRGCSDQLSMCLWASVLFESEIKWTSLELHWSSARWALLSSSILLSCLRCNLSARKWWSFVGRTLVFFTWKELVFELRLWYRPHYFILLFVIGVYWSPPFVQIDHDQVPFLEELWSELLFCSFFGPLKMQL